MIWRNFCLLLKKKSTIFFQGIRSGSKFLHCVTRQNRFMVGSILKFQNKMVVMRLLWALQNIPGKIINKWFSRKKYQCKQTADWLSKNISELIQALKENDVMFGTLDSWLIYKFTKLHLSNISNSAATGNKRLFLHILNHF